MVEKSEEEQDNQTCNILTRLTALPDSVLRKLLPEFHPDSVRKSLLPLVKRLCPDSPPAKRSQDPGSPPSPDKKNRPKTLYLYTDGAARGNPGQAGAGMVIYDEEDREVFGQGYYLGQCTNNVAEYKALISGLKEAAGMGCERLVIALDSQLIVRQMTGEYKVKNASLKPLFQEVQNLLKSFKSYSVKHVPRAENKRADELANQGIDRAGR